MRPVARQEYADEAVLHARVLHGDQRCALNHATQSARDCTVCLALLTKGMGAGSGVAQQRAVARCSRWTKSHRPIAHSAAANVHGQRVSGAASTRRRAKAGNCGLC